MKLKLTSCVGFKDLFTGQKALLLFHRRDVDDVDNVDDVDDTNDAQLSTEDFFSQIFDQEEEKKRAERQKTLLYDEIMAFSLSLTLSLSLFRSTGGSKK